VAGGSGSAVSALFSSSRADGLGARNDCRHWGVGGLELIGDSAEAQKVSYRQRLTVALLALCGCVDLTKPSPQVDLQDASMADLVEREPDGGAAMPDGPADQGLAPEVDFRDGGGADERNADRPATDLITSDAPPADATTDRAPVDAPSPDATPVDAPLPPDTAPDRPFDASGSCGSEGDCAMGLSCIDRVCAPLPGLALHWRLDETSGSRASDDTANGLHGTFGGAGSTPASTTAAPPLQFPNPASRSFVSLSGHEVRLGSLPLQLRRSNDVTITAWFRASRVTDSEGYAIILTVGDGYVLYIGETEVGFIKRLAGVDYVYCRLQNTSSHLDDEWHHLAGLTSTSGMKFFLDGMERDCPDGTGSITYSATPVVLVGRDPDINYGWFFDGEIDDVRVYTRVLSPAEVARLSAGAR
jgi:hypothetical protein